MVFNLDESEKQLQEDFINQLTEIGYDYVELNDYGDLVSNFEKQLRVFNKKSISNFNEILDYLCEGSLKSKFDKLRNPYDDIKFIDFSDVSSNIFQVTQEISVAGKFNNRYDVTILINGLPLVQIELKKSGVELNNAFRQIKRYKKHSYSDLFDFVQIFIISNKVNTRYFLNEDALDYNSTYNWGSNFDLKSFTNSFLIKSNLLNVISDYIFKDVNSNVKMLRQYQSDVIETVKKQVESNENAYVWMSYNTGKTLTSLRLAQILMEDYKIIYLTTNHLSKYPSNLAIKNKRKFIKTFKRKNLIIANIRSILTLDEELDEIKDEKIIFILNEYEKYNPRYDPLNLRKTFKNSLFYCFTSAPIFDENLINGETTKFLFDSKIYSYSFKDALVNQTNLDLEIEYLDDYQISKEYDFSSKARIDEISNYILEGICEKTLNKTFKSILITSSNSDLLTYYNNLKGSTLKIAPILRYESDDLYGDIPIGDYLSNIIDEYNNCFNASIEYRKVVDTSRFLEQMEYDIIKRFKDGEIDLLLIDESMLYNKFKANLLGNLKNPLLNTIYLDCDLKYGPLFEVLTMVNQVGLSEKTCGNILAFRDIRTNIDGTVKLFSNNDASEKYELKSYDYYLDNYKIRLNEIANSKDFIKTYEELSSYYYILERFDDFDFKQSQKDEFNRYKDLYEQELIRIDSSKKAIPKFCLKSIDQYRIDSTYIDDLFDGKVTHESSNQSDESSKTVNIINNNQDLSKTVNIHIHVDSKDDNPQDIVNDLKVNGEVVDDYSEKLIESRDIDEEISREKIISADSTPEDNTPITVQEKIVEINPENIKEYPVEIENGDFFDNVKDRLNKDFAENKNKINVKECSNCGKRYTSDINFCYYDAGHKLINPDELEKACPVCGKKYTNNVNFCHDDAGVGLVDIRDFSKTCPLCGRVYDESINYCFYHPGVELVKKEDLVKYCPECGAKYPKNYYNCKRCESKSKLKDIEKINIKDINPSVNDYYNLKTHKNNITSLEELLTSENINKLSNFTFTKKDYDNLLENIIKTHNLILNRLIEYYDINLDELSDLEKLLLYAKAFVKVSYKDSGPDLGRFIFNRLIIDDRKPGIALEMTTIIHELSHFLISEILEQIIMEVLDTYKSDLIEAFVCYTLVKNNFNKLLDEFCAHSVEVKYTGYGYQDFSSYKDILAQIRQTNEYSNDEIEIAKLIGNTFADDIKIIFESFIDPNLRECILSEFENIKEPKDYRDVPFEIDTSLTIEDFIKLVKYILVNEIEYTSYDELEKIQYFTLEFEKNND